MQRWVAVALSVAIIALLTLGRPEAAGEIAALDPYCLICGEWGSADAVSNILLFVPFGLAIGWFYGVRWTALAGLALSAAVEVAQASIPGRFPTLGDLVWNVAGAALGAGLWPWRARLRTASTRVRVALAMALLAVPLIPATLQSAARTNQEYFAQWAPNVSTARPYLGEVESATIGGRPVRGRLSASSRVRDSLRRGEAVGVSFVSVEPSPYLSTLFRFVDGLGNEIASVSIRGADVVWAERTLANSLAFRSPSSLWTGALQGHPAGSEVSLVVRKKNGSVCLQVAQSEECGRNPTLGDGWALLAPEPGDRGVRALAGFLWLALPALAAGAVLGPAGRAVTIALAATTAIAAVLAASLPGVRTTALEVGLLGSSIVAGSALVRALARDSGHVRHA